MFPYIHNDGGRQLAGFTGTEGDCMCRAICNVTGLAYGPVYRTLAGFNMTHTPTKTLDVDFRDQCLIAGRNDLAYGVMSCDPRFIAYMHSLGFSYKDYERQTKRLASMPATGRHVLILRAHATALIDGQIVDQWDCTQDQQCRQWGVYEKYTLRV